MNKFKSFRKIISVVVALAAMLAIIPVYSNAQSTAVVYEHEVQLLKELGILSETLASNRTKKITRDEFSEMLTAMLGVGGGGNAIEELYNLGIVHGYSNGKLLGNQNITTYEAIKMLVNALGYETLAELQGGYPLGYVEIAYETDLLSGNVENKELTVEDAVRLAVDAGNSPMAKISNDSLLHGIEMGGKTLFYTYFDVVRDKGIVVADGYTTINNKSCIPGEIILGETSYDVGETSVADYLGYYTEVYAYDGDVSDTIIAAAPVDGYNKTVTTIAGTDVEATGNLSEFQVKYEYENSFKKINVGKNYKVVLNGKLCGDVTLDYLNSSVADVTYIDNSKDNEYDVIIINEYETFVVKSLNKTTYNLYGKYDKMINVDAENLDVSVYDVNGKTATVDDITTDSVVSVLRSRDGEVIKIYILGTPVSGTISGEKMSGSHRVVTIGSNDYVITSEFENLQHADKITNIVVGANVQVYLDRNNNIVEMISVDDVWTYAYLMRLTYDENKETCTGATLFDQTKKQLELTIGDRLVVDGRSYKSTDIGSTAMAALDETGFVKAERQLVRYKVSGSKLTNIDTAVYNSEVEAEDSLQLYTTEIPEGTPKFNKNSGYVYVDDKVLYGSDDTTLLFTVPSDASIKDLSYYTVQNLSSMSDNAQLSNVKVYNVDDAKIGRVYVREMKDNKRAGTTSNYVIVKSVSKVVNKDGDVVNKLDGVILSTGAVYSKESTIRNTDTSAKHVANTVLETAGFGDCLSYRDVSIPGYGSVLWSALKTFGPNVELGLTLGSDVATTVDRAGTYSSERREYAGRLIYANDTAIIVENSDGSANIPFKIKDRPILLADCAEETITKIDAAAVSAYAMEKPKIVVITSKGLVYGAVIYTNVD